jgi:predicted DNA-binding protein
MADGELVLKLDDETARRLKAAADSAGQSVAVYAADLITHGLIVDWAEDLRRFEEYDRTGEYISLEEGLTYFRDAVEERLTSRK